MSLQIKSLIIRDYKGIEETEVPVGERGVVAVGRNGSGKTSILDAIRTALAGANAGPDAVRLGAERAEILLDLGDAKVRRVIRAAGGTTVSVETAEGDKKAKPAAFLAGLIGAGTLDPIEIVAEKDPARRRAAILRAIPMTVDAATLAELGVQADDTSGHALEVAERIHQANLKAAGALAKDAAAAEAVAQEAAAKASAAFAGTYDPAAEAWRATAVERLADVRARARAAAAAEERGRATLEQARSLESEAESAERNAGHPPPPDHIAALRTDATEARGLVATLASALEKAKAELAEAERLLASAELQVTRHREATTKAAALRDRAAGLRMALGASPAAPTIEEIQEATKAVEDATEAVKAHAAAIERRRLDEAAASARRAYADVVRKRDTAKAACEISRALPGRLLERAQAIPGLTLDGGDVCLDGVKLGQVNEGARLELAVRLAKRASPKVKVLVTDHLERLDPDALARFYELATSDGWQLVGARVERGDLRIEAVRAGAAS